MIQIHDKSKCNGCHACYNACPKHCIEMKTDEEGFLYPVIETSACINCGKCKKVCPVLNEKTENPDALLIGYAAYNKDDAIRLKSSSGGVFTLLSEWIIRQGGVVFGAAMTDDCKGVRHIVIETTDDLDRLRGSKYLQSAIEDTYSLAEKHLRDNRKVLFTGTPCQIGGLLSFLGKDYDNLYTQDLICHGVPSPLVWKEYVRFREAEAVSKARRIVFRKKDPGWRKYSLSLEFSNDTAYDQSIDGDLYLRGFLANIYLRPSCYDCAFKTLKRQSDITLADFWGINQVYPEMDDDKGTSFVWVHSEKGKQLFEAIEPLLATRFVQPEEAIRFNPSAIKSVDVPPNRKVFFDKKHNQDLPALIEKLVRPSLKKRIKSKLRRICHRIVKS